MPDAHDRIGLGERVVGQRQQAEVGAAGGLARQIEHRRRRISCDDPVPGIEQVPREEAAATADLEHEPAPLAHRLEQLQDPRGARVGVKAEAQVVDQREVAPVVRVVGRQGYEPSPGGSHTSSATSMTRSAPSPSAGVRTSPTPTQTTSFSHR